MTLDWDDAVKEIIDLCGMYEKDGLCLSGVEGDLIIVSKEDLRRKLMTLFELRKNKRSVVP